MGNLCLLLAMKLFFFAQRRIEQRSGLYRQCAAVCAFNNSLGVQELKVLPNRNLRNMKASRQIVDEHASIPIQNLQYLAAAFFVE